MGNVNNSDVWPASHGDWLCRPKGNCEARVSTRARNTSKTRRRNRMPVQACIPARVEVMGQEIGNPKDQG